MERFSSLQGRVFEQWEDADDEFQLREASPPARLLPLGRILSTLISAEGRDLRLALTDNSSRLQRGPLARTVSDLVQHAKLLVQKGSSLDPLVVPLLEQVVKSRDHTSRKAGFCLLRLLIENNDFGWGVAMHLVRLIQRKEIDNRVRLGWCLVVRELIQSGSVCCKPMNTGQLLDDIGPQLDIVMLFANCIVQLVSVVCQASVSDGKRRSPTRLATAAADCVLIITKALASGLANVEDTSKKNPAGGSPQKRLISPVESNHDGSDKHREVFEVDDQEPCSSGRAPEDSQRRRERVLWDHLDSLVLLVVELQEWSTVSRPLHAAGLQQVQKRLQMLAKFRDSLQAEGGEGTVGIQVLAACWEQYSGLLVCDDPNLSRHPEAVVQQWMGALQYYSQDQDELGQNGEMSSGSKKRADEMRRYALACLALVLGRLGPRQFDLLLEKTEQHLLQLLLNQLRRGDDQAVDLSVAVVRAILFRAPTTSQGSSSVPDVARLEALIPSFMELLDARDFAARAVVLLIAEFFAANPGSPELEQLFIRLDSAETVKRRNALDILGELLSIATRATDVADSLLSRTIAKHLLSRLGDEELSNRVEASALFAKLDPNFVLPALVSSMFSLDGRIRSSASCAILSLLKSHSNHGPVISLLLDCITNLSETPSAVHPGQAERLTAEKSRSRVDIDPVMSLLPSWAATVQDWDPLLKLILNKMEREPSNPVLPRFLSQISPYIEDKSGIVFSHVLEVMMQQQSILPMGDAKSWQGDTGAMATQLFQRLSPLLVLKVLPLKMFSDSGQKHMYGNLLSAQGCESDESKPTEGGIEGVKEGAEVVPCVASLLMQRVCATYEFQHVRKLASELAGRLLPNFLLPRIAQELEQATVARDTIQARACIYALCNSLMIRGKEILFYPEMSGICVCLISILLWPSSDEASSEIVKTQHGCIDCFAMIILAELGPGKQASEESSLPTSQAKPKLSEEMGEAPMDVEDIMDRQVFAQEVSLEPQLQEISIRPKPSQTRPVLIEEVSGRRSLIEEITDKSEVIGPVPKTGARREKCGVCATILSCLTGQKSHVPFIVDEQGQRYCKASALLPAGMHFNRASGTSLTGEYFRAPVPLRLCMANVLISVCQKISLPSRQVFARLVVPPVMNYAQSGTEPPIKAACLQVLFSAVYHMKAPGMLPYCTDLLRLSTALIRGPGPTEVRVGAVKVLTALLASEETVINELAADLPDARTVLDSVSRMDTSSQIRTLCEQLLGCMITPVNTVL